MGIKEEIQAHYKSGSLVTKLIFINAAVFVAISLLKTILFLAGSTIEPDIYTSLSADPHTALTHAWTLISFMFVHDGFIHFIINMLMLYWAGTLFMQMFTPRDSVNLYLLGGLCGGLFFLLSYAIFPTLNQMANTSLLCGASASIMALMVATAVYQPDYVIRMAFIGEVKLKWVVLALVVISLLNIPNGNAGGDMAHIGGAAAGALFAINIRRGMNIAAWVGKVLDALANLFARKPKWKVAYRKDDTIDAHETADMAYNRRKRQQEQNIDNILDKIKQGGYDSLNSDEKKQLFDASKQ